ncbi:MAG: hypothetical protein KDI13_10225 [Alphaproteobacteria bacterium]|nr:hypothetical protein [Alphaproteobacteria bacterium]
MSAFLLTGAALPQEALSEPYVTIHHRPETVPHGGHENRTLDCGTLVRSSGKLFLTCEAAQQIDPIGDKSTRICTDTDNMPADPEAQKYRLSSALMKTLNHFSTMHGDCTTQYGKLLTRYGKDPARIIDQNWQSANPACSLLEARNQCEAALER